MTVYTLSIVSPRLVLTLTGPGPAGPQGPQGEQGVTLGPDFGALPIRTTGSLQTGTNVRVLGLQARGSGVDCAATGAASDVSGSSCVAGRDPENFTCPANGTTLTIAGDKRGLVSNGDTARISVDSPAAGTFHTRTIVSVPAFGAGNTTFTISSAIDAVSTAGLIVVSNSGAIQDGVGARAGGVGTRAQGASSDSHGHVSAAFAPASFVRGAYCKAFAPGAGAGGEQCWVYGIDSWGWGGTMKVPGFAAAGFGASSAPTIENCTHFVSSNYGFNSGRDNRVGNIPREFVFEDLDPEDPTTSTVRIPGGNYTAEFTNGHRIPIRAHSPRDSVAAYMVITSVPVFAGGDTTFTVAREEAPGESDVWDTWTTGGETVDSEVGICARAGGASNIVTGNFADVGGVFNNVSGEAAGAWGRFGNASAARAFIAGGDNNVITGPNSCIGGGNSNNVSGTDGFASGELNNVSATAGSAIGVLCVVPGLFAHGRGIQAKAAQPNERAFASGCFGVAGDAQTRQVEVRGSTPGAAAGESVVLVSGLTGVSVTASTGVLEPSKSYLVRVMAVATRTGLGTDPRQSAQYYLAFGVDVDSAGTVTVSAVANVIPAIVTGAAFVGATLIPTSAGANDLTLTFAIAGGLTVQSRISALLEYVEVLGT